MSKLYNIQEALGKFKPGQSESLADKYFDKDDYMMTWQINSICNFNCPYCGHYIKDDPNVYKYSPAHIEDCFNKTEKTWHIIITGGEPFLHKHIIEICERLTKKHFISINTNLSLPLVKEFADKIDPKKVLTVNASIHYSVRKERNIVDEYFEHFLYLQKKGFTIVGSYVVYPNTIPEFIEDIEFFKSKGMKLVSSKVFEGEYNGKIYPDAYTDDEMKIIENYMSSAIEMPQYLKYRNFKGQMCSTGRRMLSLKPNGDLERCLSDFTPLGNFFSGTYKIPKRDKVCKTEICTCPYQGLLFTYNKKKNWSRWFGK